METMKLAADIIKCDHIKRCLLYCVLFQLNNVANGTYEIGSKYAFDNIKCDHIKRCLLYFVFGIPNISIFKK
jgi:hypothetical protein